MPEGNHHHPRPGPTWRSRGRRLLTTLTLSSLVLGTLAAPGIAAPAPDGPAPAVPAPAAPAQPFVDEQVLYKQGDFGYACYRIPAVVRATNGMVLAFAEGRVKDCGDDEDIDLVLRRSTDDGRTWGPLQVVSEGNGNTHGNPVPIVDRRTGRIVLVSTHNGPAPCPDGCDRDPYLQVSDDNGATWSAPRELTEGKRPEWNHWYATGPMHGIQLERGPHAGRLVVGASFESWDRVGPHVYGSHLLYSDDSGQTWQIGAETSRDDGSVIAQELTVVELADGRIYASARERGTDPGSRAYAISSDGGDTWDAPFRTVPALATTDVQASLLSFSDDRILFSSPMHPNAREAMGVRSSYDNARSFETWNEGKVFYWGPTAYSDMVRLDGDEAALMYEAGAISPYESIRYARFNEAYLDTPNGTPPNLPGPPAPGPTTVDSSPYHNPAYVRGGAGTTPGRFGNGLALDRVDDRVEVPFDKSIDLGAGDFTLTSWIRYSATTGAHSILWFYRVNRGTNPPALWLRAEPASNRIRAILSVDRYNVTVQSPSAYNDGKWHFVVLQRAGGELRLLVDGVEVSSAAAPAGSVTLGKEFGIDGLHVGQRLDGVDRFQGTLDEVRVYQRALSATELALVKDRNLPIGGRLGLRLPLDTVR
ncbi:exo-alpha-sialidase [Plantactinospora mayteni]|uniref:exo-alpha-sialidase n=1 Tax=Plantactinospora mayteni TaxID=566021 RepID=A0ABQ4EJJ4_9ACTN|nr:sialidase family protein [Plantactinospora mayteni]GIG94367.1 neuramidase [Plantactinospora mayteni]